MKIILSIKPEFAEKIFNGDKKYEYRRSIFKNTDVKCVVVYASAPVSKVIGEFEIDDVIINDINSLWQITKDDSGITEDYFFDYFEGKVNGYAIRVKHFIKYNEQLCIKESYGKTPPQSFSYLHDDDM